MAVYSSEFASLAEQRLTDSGFYRRLLSELNLPPTLIAETPDNVPVGYQVYGDLANAGAIVIDIVPYSVSLDDLPTQVHLAGKQAALGEEYCVVGVQPYDPQTARYSKEELSRIARGNFRPMADRVLTVIQKLSIKDDQELVLQGYSLGADISIETAFQILTNEQRGIRRVDRLGAVEYARGKTHKIIGGVAVGIAFARSGGELFNNIVASNSLALLRANNIDLDDPKAQKKHQAAITKGVLAYARSDPRASLAGFWGAATDASLQQLNVIGDHVTERPLIKVGRMDRSRICRPAFIDKLVAHDDLETFVEPGDHASGDELRRSVSFVLRTVN